MACAAEQDARALDVAKLLQTPQQIQILITLATKRSRMGLARRLGELARMASDLTLESSAPLFRTRNRVEGSQFESMDNNEIAQNQMRSSPSLDRQDCHSPFANGNENGDADSLSTTPIFDPKKKFRVSSNSGQRKNPFKVPALN